jgi:hypothetical protein
MNVSERPDRWSITGNDFELDTLRFDQAVTFVLTTGDERLEIRVEECFRLSGKSDAPSELDPEGDPVKLAPVLGLLRRQISRVDAFDDGHLELEFVDGTLVVVPQSDQYEPWGIVGERGFRIVSVPANGLAVWMGSEPKP